MVFHYEVPLDEESNGRYYNTIMPIYNTLCARKFIYFTHLVAEGKMDLATIANACGYKSAAVFSGFFKTETGLSPCTWRKEHCKSIKTKARNQ